MAADMTCQMGLPPGSVPLIRSGERTLTFRLGTRYLDRLAPGEPFTVFDTATGEDLAVVVEGLATTVFGQLPLHAAGHQGYGSREEMARVFAGYYGAWIAADAPMLVIWFRLPG